MKLFNFKNKEKRGLTATQINQVWKLLEGYNPIYTTYTGSLYEMTLIRSTIDIIANQCSKLNPKIDFGVKKYSNVKTMLTTKPNKIMTMQQFLYKLVTIYLAENNAYIVPIYDEYYEKIVGLYPVRGAGSEILMYNGEPFLKYKVDNKYFYEYYKNVGHLKRHYYDKEFIGTSNDALQSTMDLISTQEQGITAGIKSAATIRFLAKLNVVMNPESLKKEQERLKNDQLSVDNNNGVLIFDNKYSDVQKVDSKPFIVDKDQMEIIKSNVFDYFHVSENILQNKATEDEWNSFYEGCIEPIAIQIGEVLTNMLINSNDINSDKNITLESTKLQFASNSTKLQVSQQLFDRGILSTNQVMDIWQMPHVPDGDKRYIRKEYTDITELNKDLEGDDNNGANSDSGTKNSSSNGSDGNSQDTTKN